MAVALLDNSPFLNAFARKVVVLVTLMGFEYMFGVEAVGAVPSVVYRIVDPVVDDIVTLTEPE